MLDMTLVIAHRGASHHRPENTIEAFRHAAELGADGVELDVRRTADDRLVVVHDPVTADGHVVRRTPFRDLPDEVPLLDDALDACAGMFVNIEIKNLRDEPDHDPTDWVAFRLTEVLARRGTPSRWLVSSFRRRTVAMSRRLLPSVRTAWLTTDLSDERISAAVAGGHAAVHPEVSSVTADRVAAAHAVGTAVNVWTCDDTDRMRELIAWGVDGICTNRPDLALAARGG